MKDSPLGTFTKCLFLMSSVTPYRPEPTVLNEILMEGHNWFLNQFVEIPQNSNIVCFLSFFGKSRFNAPTIWEQWFINHHDHRPRRGYFYFYETNRFLPIKQYSFNYPKTVRRLKVKLSISFFFCIYSNSIIKKLRKQQAISFFGR